MKGSGLKQVTFNHPEWEFRVAGRNKCNSKDLLLFTGAEIVQ